MKLYKKAMEMQKLVVWGAAIALLLALLAFLYYVVRPALQADILP
jgi:hypothetical protein